MLGEIFVDLKVSVIIPVYNVEKYLDKCVSSVVNQTYKNLEIILVDDGSPDKCPEMCDEWAKKDSRIKVIHKENGGQGTARNMALDIMSGEYLTFVDSDDYITNNMIQELVCAVEKYSADLVLCGAEYKSIWNTSKYEPYGKELFFSSKELIKEYLTTSNILSTPWAKLYHKDIFKNIKFPSLRANEDAYILHETFDRAEKTVYIPKCLYIQFVRMGSTETSGFSLKNLALLECAEQLISFCKNKYPEFLKYVVYKKAIAAQILMRKINCEFSRYKNRKIYNDLRNILAEEYINVKNEFPGFIPPIQVESAFLNHTKFTLKCYLYGVKTNIKKIMKLIVFKIFYKGI